MSTRNHSPTGLPTRLWTASKEDSEDLAARIVNYWSIRGREVKVSVASVVDYGEGQVHAGGTVYCIRSNMLNGWPPKDKDAPINARSVPLPPVATPSHSMVRA